MAKSPLRLKLNNEFEKLITVFQLNYCHIYITSTITKKTSYDIVIHKNRRSFVKLISIVCNK